MVNSVHIIALQRWVGNVLFKIYRPHFYLFTVLFDISFINLYRRDMVGHALTSTLCPTNDGCLTEWWTFVTINETRIEKKIIKIIYRTIFWDIIKKFHYNFFSTSGVDKCQRTFSLHYSRAQLCVRYSFCNLKAFSSHSTISILRQKSYYPAIIAELGSRLCHYLCSSTLRDSLFQISSLGTPSVGLITTRKNLTSGESKYRYYR